MSADLLFRFMRFFFTCLLTLGALPLSSCLKIIKPAKDFAHLAAPEAPDYRMEDNWAALPDRRDSADVVPRGTLLQDRQRDAPADVFFVHPTTYYWRKQWNASLSDERLNHFTDKTVIRGQATAFNGTARVYAPRYRQATLYSFFDEQDASGKAALDLAYLDVKAAFQYYLDNYNHGRPIIIAGHSQGTVHAVQLLQDFFETTPRLRRQLVAAYLIGFNVQATEFRVLRPCEDSTQTGCYVAWNTVAWGSEYQAFEKGVAVNPLTWTRDTATAPVRLHLGAVPQDFDRLEKRLTAAKVHKGLVWIHPPEHPGYPRFLLPGRPELRNSFHIADYGLFYGNLRQNAGARVRAYRMLLNGQ